MSVSADVTLSVLTRELAAAEKYAAAAGVELDVSVLTEADLRFYATFKNRDGEEFHVEFDCREYPLHPPIVEFVNGDRTSRGLPRLYPVGFHPMPCICMRYNRKAYVELSGPHGDWRLVDWRLPTGQGVGIDSVAMMLSDLDSKIRDSSGRMG